MEMEEKEMLNGTNGYSLADIATATNREGDGMFGGNGAWWIIILFLFCFNGGWGNNNGSRVADDVSYGFDINGLDNGIRTLGSDLCGVNSTILQGFAGVNNTVNTTASQLMLGLTNATNGIQNSL